MDNNKELQEIKISEEERKELCYRYFGNENAITPAAGIDGKIYYKKKEAEILEYLMMN